ncbi:MAG: ChbG/HpnK family deacetylase [Chloroflexota bacterium]
MRITITADDAGMSAGIDTAIREMYHAHTLSTASVMMTLPAYAKQHSDFEMPCGIHLDLTEGRPISNALVGSPLVGEDGKFKGQLNTIRAGMWLSNATHDAIQQELDAQIQAYLTHYSHVEHITTHHHFHAMPALKPIVYELARQYQVKWIRNNDWRRAVLRQNILLPTTPMHRSDFAMPDYVVLVQAWTDKSVAVLWQTLQRVEGWVEIVVHPSLAHDPTFPVGILLNPDERAHERVFIEQFVMLIDESHTIDH